MPIDLQKEISQKVEFATKNGYSDSEVQKYITKLFGKKAADEFFGVKEKKSEVSVYGDIKVVTLKGDPGDDGDDGHTPTKKELLEIIVPLIPKIKQPEDGHTPTDAELLKLIKPLIPKVKDGESPSDAQLLRLIKPLIPKLPTSDELVQIIEKVMESREVEISGEEMVERINALPIDDPKKMIDAEHIKNLPYFLKSLGYTRKTFGSMYADDEVPDGTVDGVNAAFTISNTPVDGSLKVYADGIRQKLGQDYTLNGVTITFAVAPPVNTNLLVDFRY